MNTVNGSFLRLMTTTKEALIEGLGVGLKPGEAPTVSIEVMAMATMLADERLAGQEVDAAQEAMRNALQEQIAELTVFSQKERARADWNNALLTVERSAATELRERIADEYDRRIHELETIAGIPRRHAGEWSLFEEARLVKLYRAGKTEAQIARSLQRYGDAVCVRLGKLMVGATWYRLHGESERDWTQRHRNLFFRNEHNKMLGNAWPELPEHIKEAFADTPVQAAEAA